MSENKFTPGPWQIDWNNSNRDCLKNGVAVAGIIEPKSNLYVATIEADCGESNTPQANAHLIAAAPSMYEALKAVIAVADRRTVEFDSARAAIRKAEGCS